MLVRTRNHFISKMANSFLLKGGNPDFLRSISTVAMRNVRIEGVETEVVP